MSAHSRRRRRCLSEEDLWEWKHLGHAGEKRAFHARVRGALAADARKDFFLGWQNPLKPVSA
jgi:hypothetical protein